MAKERKKKVKMNKLLSRIIFVPWVFIRNKILHKPVGLDRLYKYGYCSRLQYKICKLFNKEKI